MTHLWRLHHNLKIVPFPVWIKPFPVLKINLKLIGKNEKHFIEEVFYQRPGSGLDDSFPNIKNQFLSRLKKKEKDIEKGVSI